MSYVTLVITSYKKVTKSYWELAEVANSSIFGDRVILRNRYFFAKNKIMFLADGQCKHWSLFFESLKVFFFVQRHQHPIAVALRAACFCDFRLFGSGFDRCCLVFLGKGGQFFFVSGAVW